MFYVVAKSVAEGNKSGSCIKQLQLAESEQDLPVNAGLQHF